MGGSTGSRSATSSRTAARRSWGPSWTSLRSSGPTAQARATARQHPAAWPYPNPFQWPPLLRHGPPRADPPRLHARQVQLHGRRQLLYRRQLQGPAWQEAEGPHLPLDQGRWHWCTAPRAPTTPAPCHPLPQFPPHPPRARPRSLGCRPLAAHACIWAVRLRRGALRVRDARLRARWARDQVHAQHQQGWCRRVPHRRPRRQVGGVRGQAQVVGCPRRGTHRLPGLPGVRNGARHQGAHGAHEDVRGDLRLDSVQRGIRQTRSGEEAGKPTAPRLRAPVMHPSRTQHDPCPPTHALLSMCRRRRTRSSTTRRRRASPRSATT